MPALSIEALSKCFSLAGRDVRVLQGLTLAVKPGELVCLLGPSGCGKSTLLNIIAGFLAPGSGHVCVHGRPVTRPGADRCMVFQEDALFPWLTVAENIALGLKGRMPGRGLRAEVDRFVEMVGLRPFRGYLPRQLSGGMKQRVALARVLILKPQVLLMDEPFGALDAQTREEMQQLLLGVWRELGHTILFVTHDIGEAILLADRILVMDRHPARIARDIEVCLPRPRKTESDEFHRFYKRLKSELVH
ncbi:MAG: ABC transporter ATP-binding protein [Desulfatitalea sp.]|nr:ABC transporter ATP-binding protein [Desulfatitalea sp.]